MVNTQYSPVPGKLTSEQLKLGYWYTSHRLLLRRIFIIFLIVIDLLFISYSLYGFMDYYFFSQPAVNTLYNDLTTPELNYSYLAEISSPQPLNISWVNGLKASADKNDFVAEVVNPNASWYVPQITYHFETDEIATEPETDFILPLQTKYLMNLGYESAANVNNINLIRRVNNVKR